MATLHDQLGAKPPPMWLTSFWGFDPERWGCIGFTDPTMRSDFLKATPPGVLVAIYVTKHRGLKDERGKVLGVLEVSHERGDAQQFISGDLWARNQEDPTARGKWLYALRATRAWRIIPEEWRLVDDLLPQTYASAHALRIGGAGVPVNPDETERILRLEVEEASVFGVHRSVDPTIMPLHSALAPSRAVPAATAPYWVGETDGPKHLYILKLAGDVPAYLGRRASAVEDMSIIKVGFSKSPRTRRHQIQRAYPEGAFQWEVLLPTAPAARAPYANADVATAGEKAMKARLVRENAECLGGEFFLAPNWLIPHVWTAGRVAAEAAAAALGDVNTGSPV